MSSNSHVPLDDIQTMLDARSPLHDGYSGKTVPWTPEWLRALLDNRHIPVYLHDGKACISAANAGVFCAHWFLGEHVALQTPERLLPLEEVANRLARSGLTVKRLLRSGELPGVKIGGKSWAVREADLDWYIRSLTGRSCGPTGMETDREAEVGIEARELPGHLECGQ